MAENVRHLFLQTLEKWYGVEDSLPSSNLLRFAILRDLSKACHAWQSEVLSSGAPEELPIFLYWQDRLEKLAYRTRLTGSLVELILGSRMVKTQKPRILPNGLFSRTDRKKLLRPDQRWELAIVTEAKKLKWRFWNIFATIPVTNIEDWNQTIQKQLWPAGLVVSVDSEKKQLDDYEQWSGRWLIVMNAEIQNPIQFLKGKRNASLLGSCQLECSAVG